MKQKIVGLFLLVVWLVQNCFTFFFMQYERNACQKVSFKLAQSKYVNQKIYYFSYEDEDAIYWEKFGKEINRDGILYDVIDMENVDGGILVKCFMDKKENKILKHFKFLQKHNTGSKNGKSPIKKITPIKYFKVENNKFIGCFPSIKNPFKHTLNAKPMEAFCAIFKPPPEV